VSDELAEAERAVRYGLDNHIIDVHYMTRLELVMADYGRRGAEIVRLKADNAKYAADYLRLGAVIGEQRTVVQAATALVEEWEAIRQPADKLVWTIAEQLTDALAAAVRGETDGRV
jgi:hypothetical protein